MHQALPLGTVREGDSQQQDPLKEKRITRALLRAAGARTTCSRALQLKRCLCGRSSSREEKLAKLLGCLPLGYSAVHLYPEGPLPPLARARITLAPQELRPWQLDRVRLPW